MFVIFNKIRFHFLNKTSVIVIAGHEMRRSFVANNRCIHTNRNELQIWMRIKTHSELKN